ncbi:unnamed protein product [Amoebophrya sp. A25]|nr:unnamed protein product [Amoebophrya sp. A25]|eukprot:GSA25T00011755001.1
MTPSTSSGGSSVELTVEASVLLCVKQRFGHSFVHLRLSVMPEGTFTRWGYCETGVFLSEVFKQTSSPFPNNGSDSSATSPFLSSSSSHLFLATTGASHPPGGSYFAASSLDNHAASEKRRRQLRSLEHLEDTGSFTDFFVSYFFTDLQKQAKQAAEARKARVAAERYTFPAPEELAGARKVRLSDPVVQLEYLRSDTSTVAGLVGDEKLNTMRSKTDHTIANADKTPGFSKERAKPHESRSRSWPVSSGRALRAEALKRPEIKFFSEQGVIKKGKGGRAVGEDDGPDERESKTDSKNAKLKTGNASSKEQQSWGSGIPGGNKGAPTLLSPTGSELRTDQRSNTDSSFGFRSGSPLPFTADKSPAKKKRMSLRAAILDTSKLPRGFQ